VVAAGVLQLLWIIIAVTRCESFTLHCRDALPHLKPIVRMMGPMVFGLAVFQINTLLDTFIAFGLAPSEGGRDTFMLFGNEIAYPIADRGAPAALYLAQRLYQFPLGVFGIAIATAIYPALAHAAAERTTKPRPAVAVDGRTANSSASDDQSSISDDFRTILQHGIRLTMFIGLPASIGLILIRLPLTRIIFERNEIDLAGSQRIAYLLMGYSAAVWAYSTTHVVTRAFHAVKDATTPLKVGIMMVLLNLALNLTLIWFLGEVGLAWSSSISASANIALLLFAVRKYVAHPMDASVWRSWGRSAIMTAVMAAGIAPLHWVFDPHSASQAETAALLASMVTLGALIYAGGAALLKAPELRWLLKRDAA
jgi:putative peptidoglycan lipid II flippase